MTIIEKKYAEFGKSVTEENNYWSSTRDIFRSRALIILSRERPRCVCYEMRGTRVGFIALTCVINIY